MKLYSENKNYKLYEGSMLDMLEVIEPNSIDSIITDPPYGLTSITKRFGKENSAECKYGKDGSFARLSKGFMGKEWDGSGIEYNIETWKKCYEVLKPGGYLLAFGGSRTFHRIACAIEDAGFEIRDTIMWLYGSGFPKSMNLANSVESKLVNGNGNKNQFKKLDGEKGTPISYCSFTKKNIEQGFRNKDYAEQDYETTIKVNYTTDLAKQWDGWGTALKPSFEPIIVARKPFKGSLVDNVIENGVGGINIDECRVGNETISIHNAPKGTFAGGEYGRGSDTESYRDSIGRFPANTILTYDETDFDEVCGGFPNTKSTGGKRNDEKTTSNMNVPFADHKSGEHYVDSGSASRYFYCAKASKKDRDEGLDTFIEEKVNDGRQTPIDNAFQRGETLRKNTHPTVKPTELMQYLVRLVTPDGGTILDPFNGSGSTGKAVMYENKEKNKNYKYIGIELTKEYLPIAKARIEYVYNLKEESPQLSLF